MAEQPTPPSAPEQHVTPDHEVLHALVQKLRGASVVDNQVTRTVSLSEADAKELADTLEQMATRLEAHPAASRPGRPATPDAKP